jgi:hypothetical protein
MALHAVVSPGGSPGVTTAALAMALTWPGDEPVIVAECDPSGGDVMAGFFAGHMTAPVALAALAAEASRGAGAVAAALPGLLTTLDKGNPGRCLLLDGISDPRQAPLLAPSWPVIAEALAAWPGDVIADCGRLDPGCPEPALRAAATVTMVLHPTLRQVASARSRIDMLAAIGARGWPAMLLVTGKGPEDPRDIAKTLGADLVAPLPHDPKTARVLSEGAGRRHSMATRPLMRAARTAACALHARPAGTGRRATAVASP